MLYIKTNELKELWKSCKKNWWLFCLSFLGCMAIASVFIFVKSKKFEVYTSVNITDSGIGGDMMAAMAKSSGFGDILGVGGTEVANEMVIMESHHVLYNAVKATGYNVMYSSRPFIKRRNYWKDTPLLITALDENYNDTLLEGLSWKVKMAADGSKANIYCKTVNHGVIYDKDNIALPAEIQTDWGRFRLEKTEFFEPGKSLKVMVNWFSYTNVAQMLMKELEIRLIDKKANIVQLSYKDAVPPRCAALLNAIVASYEQYGIEAKNRSSQISMDFLQQRIDTVNHELSQLEYAIEQYKIDHKIGDVERQVHLTISKASELESTITNLEILIGNLNELENYLDNPAHQFDPLPIVATGSEDAAKAIMEYNAALSEYLDLKRNTTANNPSYIAAQEMIAGTREALRLTIHTAKSNAQSTMSRLAKKSNQLLGMVNSIPTVEREYVELKREQELKQKVYLMLLTQQEQNALNISMDQPKSQLVDEAYVNVLPSGPKAIVVLAIALFFALFLPLAWFRFLAMICPTLQSPEQLKKLEGFSGDIHTLSDGNNEDIKQLCLELISRAQHKDQSVVLLSMQDEERQSLIAQSIQDTLASMKPSAHAIVLKETPAFTQKSDVMYELPHADLALLVVRKGITRLEHLSYIETLIEKQLLNQLLTAFQH